MFWNYIQLILEQHEFELHGSTYTCIFFPINTDSTCLLHVLRLGREGKGRKGKRILHDLRLLVKSMDVELQIGRGDCGT